MISKIEGWMKDRKEGVFDGIAETRDDMLLVPKDAAAGSIVLIEDEDVFTVKRSDGIWQDIPARVLYSMKSHCEQMGDC